MLLGFEIYMLYVYVIFFCMYCTVRVMVIYTVVQYRKLFHKKGKNREKRNIKYIRKELSLTPQYEMFTLSPLMLSISHNLIENGSHSMEYISLKN